MIKQSHQLMTIREVAAELRLGESTVWRHVKDGALPSPIRIRGATRWLQSEIRAFIERLAHEQRDVDLRPQRIRDLEG